METPSEVYHWNQTYNAHIPKRGMKNKVTYQTNIKFKTFLDNLEFFIYTVVNTVKRMILKCTKELQ